MVWPLNGRVFLVTYSVILLLSCVVIPHLKNESKTEKSGTVKLWKYKSVINIYEGVLTTEYGNTKPFGGSKHKYKLKFIIQVQHHFKYNCVSLACLTNCFIYLIAMSLC